MYVVRTAWLGLDNAAGAFFFFLAQRMLARSCKRSPLSRLAVAQQRRGGPLTGSAAALSTSSTWQWLKSLFSPPTPAPVTQASGPSSVAAGAPAAIALQPRGRVAGKLCVAAIDPPPNFDASCAAVARAVAGAETVLLAVCKADLLPQLSPGELESLRRRFERRRPGVSCASAFGVSATAAESSAHRPRNRGAGHFSDPSQKLPCRRAALGRSQRRCWRRRPGAGTARLSLLGRTALAGWASPAMAHLRTAAQTEPHNYTSLPYTALLYTSLHRTNLHCTAPHCTALQPTRHDHTCV